MEDNSKELKRAWQGTAMGIKEVQMSKMTEASPLSNYSSQVSATKMLCNEQSQSQRITIGISFLLLGMQVSLTL